MWEPSLSGAALWSLGRELRRVLTHFLCLRSTRGDQDVAVRAPNGARLLRLAVDLCDPILNRQGPAGDKK